MKIINYRKLLGIEQKKLLLEDKMPVAWKPATYKSDLDGFLCPRCGRNIFEVGLTQHMILTNGCEIYHRYKFKYGRIEITPTIKEIPKIYHSLNIAKILDNYHILRCNHCDQRLDVYITDIKEVYEYFYSKRK